MKMSNKTPFQVHTIQFNSLVFLLIDIKYLINLSRFIEAHNEAHFLKVFRSFLALKPRF